MVLERSFRFYAKTFLSFLSIILIFTGTAVTATCDLINAPKESTIFNKTSRSTDYSIDAVTMQGYYVDGKAVFILNYTVFMYTNASVEIPLIGPSESAMAINLSMDGTDARVEFNNNFYLYKGTLKPGEHNLTFQFSSKLLSLDTKVLYYNLHGPALIYQIDFKIQKMADREIYFIENVEGDLIEKIDSYLIMWEYYATDEICWQLVWSEYKKPDSNNIRCELEADAYIIEGKAKLNVHYDIIFPGCGLKELLFELDSLTVMTSADKGTIKNENGFVKIEFSELILDSTEINIEFQKIMKSNVKITIPAPNNCRFTGNLAVFADSKSIVQLIDNSDTVTLGYINSQYPDSYFIGNYLISELTALTFNITERDLTLTADVMETIEVTGDGYILETIIHLSFSGNNPSSIKIDFNPNPSGFYIAKPEIWVKSTEQHFVLDYNWDAENQKLVIFLNQNLTGDYIIGIRRQYTGNDVYMNHITISDFQIINYFIVYYLEKGVIFNIKNENKLLRSDYDSVTKNFKTFIKTGSNSDIYLAPDAHYEVKFNIEKTFDLKTEMFLRTWVTEKEKESKQVVRISSANLLMSSFSFSIPPEHSELDVKGVASWSINNERLTVYVHATDNHAITITINSKLNAENNRVTPFLPLEIDEYEIYSMFGSSSSLKLNITPEGAELINIDELPAYFKSEIRTPKAVNIYYSSESPQFFYSIGMFLADIPPSTIIEQAQITLITSTDGRNAVQVIYMVKNVELLDMEVILPLKSVVWMVLVAGKTVPIIQNDNKLTITLIRSTLVGENIAFPVEFIYMVKEPSEDLKFLLPAVDVSILSMKINIGLPKSLKILDPGKTNPDLEYQGQQPWRISLDIDDNKGGDYVDYNRAFDTQMSGVWSESENTKSASLTIGVDDIYDNSKPVIISKFDGSGRFVSNMTLSTYQFNIDPESNFGYKTVSLSQGNYVVTNAASMRKVSVIGGVAQQILFDSEDDMVFTPAPPIYLQFPESGKVLRFSTIFVLPEEQISILIEEARTDDSQLSLREKLSSVFDLSIGPMGLVIILIIIIVIVVYYFLIIRRVRLKRQMYAREIKGREPKQESRIGKPKRPRRVVVRKDEVEGGQVEDKLSDDSGDKTSLNK
jgi:hypothetical protein